MLHINLGNTDIIGQGLCSKGLMVVASKAIPSHYSVEYVYTVIIWKSYGFFEGMYLKTNWAMGCLWVHVRSHTFPIVCEGNFWVLWYWYGMWIKGPIIALPYSFPVDQSMLYYGNYMELYEIHSNPTEQGEDHMLLLWGTPIPFPSKKLWRMYGPLIRNM